MNPVPDDNEIAAFAEKLEKKFGRRDLHSHTFLSDGELLPMEHIRRAYATGHKAVAITDHVSFSNMETVINQVIRDCEAAEGIVAIPGVELTHIPPSKIEKAAKQARKLGAKWVVLHGETLVEPVAGGTNLAGVISAEIDLLAHPGLLSEGEAARAAQTGTYIEITARKGHCLSNGHVYQTAKEANCKLMINTDAHVHTDFIDTLQAVRVGLGAGMDFDDIEAAFKNHDDAVKKVA